MSKSNTNDMNSDPDIQYEIQYGDAETSAPDESMGRSLNNILSGLLKEPEVIQRFELLAIRGEASAQNRLFQRAIDLCNVTDEATASKKDMAEGIRLFQVLAGVGHPNSLYMLG